MRKGGEPSQGFESFHSDLTQARWHNVVFVECLWMIKSVVVGFCFNWGWCYSEWWVWDLITLGQFPGSEMSSGLFQVFMDGCIRP